MVRWQSILVGSAALLTTAMAALPALADDDGSTPWIDPPAKPADPDAKSDPSDPDALPQLPPNVQVQPDGGVVVTRTPQQGVEVHARTPSGTVHAYGCDRVVFDPNDRAPAPPPGARTPCPMPPPAPPAPPPQVYYRVPGRYYQPPVVVAPRHPRDPARTAALISSSLIFGIGTLVTGTGYLMSDPGRYGSRRCALLEGCMNEESVPLLWTMGAFLTVTPSIPRFVVGDVGFGLMWTGLRAGSFALGAAVDWGDQTALMASTFSFIVPLTLGIVDLATTPRRKLAPQALELAGLKIDGLGPTSFKDLAGNAAPAFGASGRF